jgi:hypothetical protein
VEVVAEQVFMALVVMVVIVAVVGLPVLMAKDMVLEVEEEERIIMQVVMVVTEVQGILK